MADENTESAGITRPPRKIVVVSPTMATDGGYIPAVVVEGEPGMRPLTGQGDYAAPWVWGPSFAEAQQQAREHNARRGLTPDDVAEVLLSSIAAQDCPECLSTIGHQSGCSRGPCPECRGIGGHKLDCSRRSA